MRDARRLEGGGTGGVAEAEDAEVLEAAFEDVDEFVVAVGVGGGHEEAGAEDVVVGVGDDALDGFAIMEADAYPEALHDRGVLVEVEGAVAEVSVKGHDEEDGLSAGGGDLADFAVLDKGEADGVEGVLGVVAKELLEGADLAGEREAADGVVFKPDDDFVGAGGEDRLCGRLRSGAYA